MFQEIKKSIEFLLIRKKKATFAMISVQYEMEKKTMTREEALTHFLTARQHKREVVADLEKTMKAEYEKETGKKANYFFSL